MSLSDIDNTIRKDKQDWLPVTRLICLENTNHGEAIPLDYFEKVKALADKYNIRVHLDGARFFNACTELNIDPKDLASQCDSVMFCLSKGLCCPVGSMLVGTEEFIKKARKFRKTIGGGMRQVGILAAAGIIALEKMRFRLKEDHENAALFKELVKGIEEIKISDQKGGTNMVFWEFTDKTYEQGLVPIMKDQKIKVFGSDKGTFRFVFHYYVNRERTIQLVEALKRFVLLKREMQ